MKNSKKEDENQVTTGKISSSVSLENLSNFSPLSQSLSPPKFLASKLKSAYAPISTSPKTHLLLSINPNPIIHKSYTVSQNISGQGKSPLYIATKGEESFLIDPSPDSASLIHSNGRNTKIHSLRNEDTFSIVNQNSKLLDMEGVPSSTSSSDIKSSATSQSKVNLRESSSKVDGLSGNHSQGKSKLKKEKSKQPPDQFAQVESGVYRSALPSTSQHFAFLNETIALKTILFLSQEVPTLQMKKFCEKNDVTLINLGIHLKQHRHLEFTSGSLLTMDRNSNPILFDSYSNSKYLREELVKEALQILLNVNYHPILITCVSGIHLTGTIVSCLRKMQYWSLTSILDEFRSFTGEKGYRYANEQFIELFDPDLITIPLEESLAPWFKLQRDMMREELLEYQRVVPQLEEEKPLEKNDVRKAYHYYYYRSNVPLVSIKSEGEFTEKSLIEEESE